MRLVRSISLVIQRTANRTASKKAASTNQGQRCRVRAPGFNLSDSEGVSYPISPGGGTPTVLIFNMGVT